MDARRIPRQQAAGRADSLAEFVQGRIAGYKRPRVWIEVDAIPRMPNGKADYKAARALAEGGVSTN